jgi:WD40 repeat protein
MVLVENKNKIIIIDLNKNKIKNKINIKNESEIESILINSNGKYIVTVGDDYYKIWDVNLKENLITIKKGGWSHGRETVSFNPDGNILALISSKDKIQIWDIKKKKIVRTINNVSGTTRSLSYNPDGNILAILEEKNKIKLYDVKTGSVIRIIPISTNVLGELKYSLGFIRFSPNGRLLTYGQGNKEIELVEVNTGKVIKTLKKHSDIIRSASFSHDGKYLATGGNDGAIIIWPFLTEIMNGDPKKLLKKAEEESGIKIIEGRLYRWNPESGIVSNMPISEF